MTHFFVVVGASAVGCMLALGLQDVLQWLGGRYRGRKR